MLGRARPVILAGAAAAAAATLVASAAGARGASADVILPLPTVTLATPLPTIPLPTVTVPVPTLPPPPTVSLPLPTSPVPTLPGLPGVPGAPAPGGPSGGGAGPGSAPGDAAASGVQLPPAARPTLTPDQRAAIQSDDESSPALHSADQLYAASDGGLATLLAQLAQFGQARAAVLQAELALAAMDAQAASVQASSADITARHDAARRAVASYIRQSYASGSPGAWSSVLGSDPSTFVTAMPAAAGGDLAASAALDRLQVLSAEAGRVEARAEAMTARATEARAQVERYAEALRQLAPYIRDAQARAAMLMAQRNAALAAMQAAGPGELALERDRQAQSGQLGQQIRAASAALRRDGKVVTGTGTFAMPSTGPVTSHYGYRYHPILHIRKLHTGVDLGQGDGWVRAADNGTVILTLANKAYGFVTVIDHGTLQGQRIVTLYAHQARFLVQPGQVVRRGQVIGVVGQTGYATGPHVHVEVRDDGVPIRPEPWFGL
jgi:murein DD-endopeptidase MepM/ murein hydrolase activator NlpD